MKVEMHINGELQIILTPETEIERIVVATMAESADKGKVFRVAGDWTGTGATVDDLTKPARLVIGVPK